jgi:hypothetical protein
MYQIAHAATSKTGITIQDGERGGKGTGDGVPNNNDNSEVACPTGPTRQEFVSGPVIMSIIAIC